VRAVLLAAVLLAAPVQGELTAYSDASYPQEWRLLHDYWFNTTTFLEDSRTFHVRIAAPPAGTYVWSLPERGGIQPDLPNPLSRLFSRFQITLDQTTWDLATQNTTTPFASDGNDLRFTFKYRIANLSPYEYTSVLEDTRRIRDAERAQWPSGNIVSRQQEVSGFIRLKQVTAEREQEPCPTGTCADVVPLAARDFNLVFNLVGEAFRLTFHPAPTRVERTSGAAILAAGSSYTSNAAYEATLASDIPVEVRLDGSRFLAKLTPGHTATVTLPQGTHRFHYEYAGGPGVVGIQATRTGQGIRDELPEPPADGWPLWWLAAILAIAAATWLALRQRRYTWYEYQRGRMYVVVDRQGIKPNRDHHGPAPILARIRRPGS
jgi:hypothetical protein